jgi:threonine/homoserine/homoserine lactone efflux protein
MEETVGSLAVFLAISATILLGAMSPGPSFVVVARTAISTSRGSGVLAALGMGVGGAVFALAGVLGLQLLLSAVPSIIYKALQIAGGAYLLFIAYKLWKSSQNPLDVADSGLVDKSSGIRAFLLGLGTQLSNPKTAIVYASVFSVAITKESLWTAAVILVPTIFLIEFGWYAFVAIAFSTGKAQKAYTNGKTWIDRLAAGAIATLAVKILADARTN